MAGFFAGDGNGAIVETQTQINDGAAAGNIRGDGYFISSPLGSP